MSNASDTKEIFKKVMKEVVVEIELRIKALSQELLEHRASQIALVSILADKGVLTTDEFDKKVEEVEKTFKDRLDELVKHSVSKGIQ